MGGRIISELCLIRHVLACRNDFLYPGNANGLVGNKSGLKRFRHSFYIFLSIFLDFMIALSKIQYKGSLKDWDIRHFLCV